MDLGLGMLRLMFCFMILEPSPAKLLALIPLCPILPQAMPVFDADYDISNLKDFFVDISVF